MYEHKILNNHYLHLVSEILVSLSYDNTNLATIKEFYSIVLKDFASRMFTDLITEI